LLTEKDITHLIFEEMKIFVQNPNNETKLKEIFEMFHQWVDQSLNPDTFAALCLLL
jgi:hypothetical protein